MSTNFTGVTFAKQKVTPADDAIVRRAILPDGILTGCALSYSGSTLTMAAGQLMVCGRQIKHPSAQNWAVSDATSGYARLLLTIDLTRTASKETFDQVVDTIEYATSADGFSELEQSDINSAGTKYQIAVCVVSLGTGGITGIVEELEKSEASAGKLFAVIGVTYPAGSTCTCTNGSKTLTAKNTFGKALFVIPSAGTWTVTAVSGSKSTSKTVSINAEGQAETVTLMFELVLFDGSNGGDVTALTGGWEADGHVSSNIVFSVGSDRISFNYAITQTQGTIKRTWFIYTKNSINMANYTTLHITFATMSGGDKWGIGVNTEIPSDFYSDNPSLTAKTATTTIKNNQTLTLSISNISKGYVMAYVSKSSDGSISMACDITRVWLE